MMRHPARTFQAIASFAAGISLALLLVPGIAQASPPGGYTGHAAGYFDNGASWGGGYVQTEIANLTAGGSGVYANEELWVANIGGNSNSWVEVGYSANQPDCNYQGLEWFWDEENNGTPGPVYCGATNLTVGTWHELEVQQVSGDTWAAYIDEAEVTPTFTMGASYNQLAQAGLEYHNSDGIQLTGDAYFSYNEVRQPSSTSWEYWPSGGTLEENPGVFDWTWTQDYIHGYDQQG